MNTIMKRNGKFNKQDYYCLRNIAQYNAHKELYATVTYEWDDITVSFTSFKDGSLSCSIKWGGLEFAPPNYTDIGAIRGCEYILESIGVLWYM